MQASLWSCQGREEKHYLGEGASSSPQFPGPSRTHATQAHLKEGQGSIREEQNHMSYGLRGLLLESDFTQLWEGWKVEMQEGNWKIKEEVTIQSI